MVCHYSTLSGEAHIIMLVTTRMQMNARPTVMTRNRMPCFLSQIRDLGPWAVAVSLSGGAGEDASAGVPVEVLGVLIYSQ